MPPKFNCRIRFLSRFHLSDVQNSLLLAALVGVLGALATIGFRGLIQICEHLLYGRADSLVQISTQLTWWQRLLAPTLGGVFAGSLLMLTQRIDKGDQGGDYMEAIVLGDGQLGVRRSCIRALSSAITVVSGGAIGREGPMVQLAALAGSQIGRWQRIPVPRRRLLVACGAAAGVATAYNAPIAGALFVAEIVLRSVAIESLGPLIVAAVSANIVASEVLGFQPVYHLPHFTLNSGIATVLFAILGICAGLLAPLFLAIIDRVRKLFSGWQAPLWLKMACGGLGVGALSLVTPAVWGNGYSVVNSILQGGWLWQALLSTLLFKLLAVSLTTGSGAVGGIFTPTLFVGAVAGALFGEAVQWLWPGLIPEPASVAVGMGAFLAACTHAPLMSVLMIFEMTENYGVVVPLMLSCVLAYFVAQVLHSKSIYASHTGNIRHAPALAMASDFLRTEPPTIGLEDSIGKLQEVFSKFRWQHVYVVDAGQRFVGAISLHDFALLPRPQGEEKQAPWPATLLKADYPRVTHNMATWQVIETFANHPGERLPVLDDDGRLLGYITKTDLVLIFQERLGGNL